MLSLKNIEFGWLKLHPMYQQLFYQETVDGDLERTKSDEIAKLYNDELVGKILQGPTAQKLMREKKTSDPKEVIPEIYALYLEEEKHPKEKIGYPKERELQEYLVSERVNALYPLYVAEMARRIETGPYFEKKTFSELADMYEVNDHVPDNIDMHRIFESLFKSKVIIDDGFTRYDGDNTLYGLFSKRNGLASPK